MFAPNKSKLTYQSQTHILLPNTYNIYESWLTPRVLFVLIAGGIIYLWTSGRLCDFDGCDTREDLKPLNINGWFWSGSNVKMAPTNKTPPGECTVSCLTRGQGF